VDLGSPSPLRHDQPGGLQHAQVLRDGLACEADAVPHREHGTDLEQRLSVACRQLVEDQTPRLVVQSQVGPLLPRDLAQYRAIESALRAHRWFSTTDEVMQRALQVQSLLAERGGLHHRRPLPDLIIAATAELHGATVLHNDKDYELIAQVTGQPVERIEQ
jgi:predicted nucleic acid-binding protein